MPFTVVYDACVLYPSTLRDLLIRIGAAGLVQAKWSERILDEVFDNLAKNRPDLRTEKLVRTRDLMKRAVRDCLVVDFGRLEPVCEVPDPDDRHVLAAAVRAGAQLIVTQNLKDFPAEALEPWGIDAIHPDDFVRAQLDLDRGRVFACIQQIADSWRNPPGAPGDVLDRLERDGLVKSAAELRSGI
ncbi:MULTISPECIES: PIN domain-containing protein [unclassified Streptomyces]|uniref:PIN domain-containing protein n=1 Tax=unclassified Streptomyces TaxID=2593676 RepID=UPI00325463C5